MRRGLCVLKEKGSPRFGRGRVSAFGEGSAGSFENLRFFPNRDGCLRMQAISDQR